MTWFLHPAIRLITGLARVALCVIVTGDSNAQNPHVVIVNCFSGGNAEVNPDGYSRNWRDPIAGVDWLIDRLDQAHDAGVSHAMLNRPMGRGWRITGSGAIETSRFVVGASWLTMEPARRAALNDKLARWTSQHPDFEVGIFVGLRMRDSLTKFTAMTKAEFLAECDPLDPRTEQGRRLVRETLMPWVACGVTAFYFDWSAPVEHREILVALRDMLAPLGVRVIGEAIPVVPCGDHKTFDREWTSQIGWVALVPFIDSRVPGEPVPEGHELYAWVSWKSRTHDLTDESERHAWARAAADRGYIIVAGLDTVLATGD